MRRDFGDSYQSVLGNKGRREPERRLTKMPIDFKGKTVLDLGCNVGGMVINIHDELKFAVGLDGNVSAIERGKRICKSANIANIFLHVCNLESEAVNKYFLCEYDCVFMLSIANWVKNWRELTLQSKKVSPLVVFEAHGRKMQEQEHFLKKNFSSVKLLLEDSEDGNLRRLLLCSR